MSAEKNAQIARRWFEELWSMGNLAVADEIISPLYAPDWVQIDKKGAEQVKHEVRYFRTMFPDLVYEIVDMAPFEDHIWVRYQGRGTHRGSAWGFEPTGKQASFEGATILSINADGQIIDRWGAFCFYDIFADLGLVPPFWELSNILNSRE
jgi:predicted ester cyclase